MKKLFITIILTAFILIPAGMGWAANTVVTGGEFNQYVDISAMDTNYDAGADRYLVSIQFNPGSTGTDVLIVRHASATGPIIMKVTANAANDESCKYFDGMKVRPYIKYSECTLSSGHRVMITYGER